MLIAAGEFTFQNAIKRTRAISGLTQQEFADHRGVSVKVLKEIERGIANLTVNTLNQIASNFELDVFLIRKRPGPQQCPPTKAKSSSTLRAGFQ